jgi:hypothetical protein
VAGLVLAQLGKDRPVEAMRTLDERGAALAGRRTATMLRATALRVAGRTVEAARLLASVPQPRDAMDWYLEGRRLICEGEGRNGRKAAFREALDACSRAIVLSTAPRALYFEERAHAAAHLGDLARARESADGLQAHWPESARAAWWRGYALAESGDPDGGIAAFRDSIRLGLGEDWEALWARARKAVTAGTRQAR